jgi:hypothetical protein
VIGYDLDGVLIGDFVEYPDGGISAEQIVLQVPLFKPVGDFYIITGRDADLEADTTKWLDQYQIYPVQIFHKNQGVPNGVYYKLAVLLAHPQITTFVESSARQVNILKEPLAGQCNVIHFATWITQSFGGLYK